MLLGGALAVVALLVLGAAALNGTKLVDYALPALASAAIFGGLLMCVRHWVVLDRRQRVAATGWGLFFPFYKTEHRFTQAHCITLSREERGSGRYRHELFAVRLEGAGSPAITLAAPPDYDKARQLAEELAKFLQFGMRDRSSGESVEREPGTLDDSLRQRTKRSGRVAPMPERPAAARSGASFAASTATIEIPAFMHWIWSVMTALLIAALSAVLIEIDSKRNDPPSMEHLFLVFLAVLAAMLPLFLFFMHRLGVHYRDRLVVSAHEVVLIRRGMFGASTTRLPADEIEEVVAQSDGVSKRVVIRYDRGSVKLAAVRTEEELTWLRQLLIHVLTAS